MFIQNLPSVSPVVQKHSLSYSRLIICFKGKSANLQLCWCWELHWEKGSPVQCSQRLLDVSGESRRSQRSWRAFPISGKSLNRYPHCGVSWLSVLGHRTQVLVVSEAECGLNFWSWRLARPNPLHIVAVVAKQSRSLDPSSDGVSCKVWVWFPVMTLVPLSKAQNPLHIVVVMAEWSLILGLIPVRGTYKCPLSKALNHICFVKSWEGCAFCSTSQAPSGWYPCLHLYGLWRG